MTTKPRDPVAAWTKALSRDESARARRMLADVPRLSRVVEIGCGRGAKLDLLRGMGFTDVLGVERNPAVAGAARARGHQVVSPEELPRTLDGRPVDVLVLAHVVEHFAWRELKDFLDEHLKLLRLGGHLFVMAPLMHPRFWIDFDHVKPYPPQAFKLFFGKDDEQVQAYSPHTLKLRDVEFRRSPLRVTYSRRLLLKRGDFAPRLVNLALAGLFAASGKIVGRTTGWLGLFEKTRGPCLSGG